MHGTPLQRLAAGPPSTSAPSSLAHFCTRRRRAACRSMPHGGGEVSRFRLQYNPQDTGLPREEWLCWPLPGEDLAAASAPPPLAVPGAGHIHVLTGAEHAEPQALWDSMPLPPGAKALRSSVVQRARVAPVPVPASLSLPGTEYWHVDALHDYSREAPHVRVTRDHVQLRKGWLAGVDDPGLVPFFLYRGLEQVGGLVLRRYCVMLYGVSRWPYHSVITMQACKLTGP
jgi:hypothetical protein